MGQRCFFLRCIHVSPLHCFLRASSSRDRIETVRMSETVSARENSSPWSRPSRIARHESKTSDVRSGAVSLQNHRLGLVGSSHASPTRSAAAPAAGGGRLVRAMAQPGGEAMRNHSACRREERESSSFIFGLSPPPFSSVVHTSAPSPDAKLHCWRGFLPRPLLPFFFINSGSVLHFLHATSHAQSRRVKSLLRHTTPNLIGFESKQRLYKRCRFGSAPVESPGRRSPSPSRSSSQNQTAAPATPLKATNRILWGF